MTVVSNRRDRPLTCTEVMLDICVLFTGHLLLSLKILLYRVGIVGCNYRSPLSVCVYLFLMVVSDHNGNKDSPVSSCRSVDFLNRFFFMTLILYV